MNIHAFALFLILVLGTSALADDAPLVLYMIQKIPVELRPGDDFAVMLINDGGEENPSPRYILAIAKSQTVLNTKDLGLFKQLLDTLPKNATLYQYNSCTVPRSWGLTDVHFKEWNTVFEHLGLALSKEPRITCYHKDSK